MLLQADQSVFDELGINSLRKTALLNKCKESGLESQVLKYVNYNNYIFAHEYKLSIFDY